MPKMKTHKGAKKRFSITGKGKVRRLKAFKFACDRFPVLGEQRVIPQV